MLKVLEPYRILFPETHMAQLCGLEGTIFKQIQNRRTFRIERGGKGFFIKCHDGVGLREVFKNLGALKLPVLGAMNEWQAITRLQELGVETMRPVAVGREGLNPAAQDSILVTEELHDCISLENYCKGGTEKPPTIADKRLLIHRLADIARTLHENGVNHRDFYLCHFLMQQPWDGTDEDLHLYLIDLHRVQRRRRTPVRWAVKDVGSLWFSVMEMDVSLTSRDLLRFISEYRQRSLREVLDDELGFWRKVRRRADALYRTRPGASADDG